MNNAIEATGLSKRFGKTIALDGLDLAVPEGTVHGFLGPNGSGKSTTIRVLLGLIRAEGGRASVLGGDPWRDAVALHRRIAYVPGDMSLWPNLTGGQAIDIIASLRGDRDAARIATFVERFDLDPSKKARSYSKGNRQKVALVAALASRAELFIFDEPTSGLDPLMERVFQSCVEEIRMEGRTVLLSSHIFSEVQRLCDAVTIIRKGRTVEVSPVRGEEDLEARFLSHYGATELESGSADAGGRLDASGSPGDVAKAGADDRGVEIRGVEIRGAHRATGEAGGAA